jgi:outer membrane protein OmpA-like peptidoglycan-associated protein
MGLSNARVSLSLSFWSENIMNKKLLGLIVVSLLLAGCATGSHFGVPDRADRVPQWVLDAEAAMARAEASAGARVCPDKIAQAKELAAKAMQTYWACKDLEAQRLMAQALRLAADAEACSAPVTRHVELSADALFAFNKATLSQQGEAALDKFLQDLHGASVSSIQVIGHTDPLGSDAYNMQLSERRANAVAQYLASRGVPADRIRAEGRGEAELKVTSEECAAQGAKTRPALIQCLQPDRRVDVTVTVAGPAAQ